MNLLTECKKRYVVIPGICKKERDGSTTWIRNGYVAFKNDTGAGNVAGHRTKLGYRQLTFRIDGVQVHVFAHVVSWMLTRNKKFPTNKVCDHIDHVTDNNDPRNLRDIAPSQNKAHRATAQSNSEHKLLGVYWYQARNKWCVQSAVNKRKVYMGYFSDPVLAVKAYWKHRLETDPEIAQELSRIMKQQLILANNLKHVVKERATTNGKYVRSGLFTNKMKAERAKARARSTNQH
jgi:hypothetical protein